MSVKRFGPGANAWVVFVGVAVSAWILCESTALGQGRMGGRHAADGKHDADSSNPAFKPLPSQDVAHAPRRRICFDRDELLRDRLHAAADAHLPV